MRRARKLRLVCPQRRLFWRDLCCHPPRLRDKPRTTECLRRTLCLGF